MIVSSLSPRSIFGFHRSEPRKTLFLSGKNRTIRLLAGLQPHVNIPEAKGK